MGSAGTDSELIGVFPVPVLRARPADAEHLAAGLEALIHAERERSDGVRRSIRRGWHSHAVIQDWNDPCARRLVEEVRARAHDWVVGTSPALAGLSPEGWAVAAWATVCGREGRFNSHTHLRSPGVLLSGVYYVNAGTPNASGELGGELVFERDPRPWMPRMQPAPLARDHRVAPESGSLLLFPSWLRHRVEPYVGEGLRISIGVNLSHPDVAVRPHPLVHAGRGVARHMRRAWKAARNLRA